MQNHTAWRYVTAEDTSAMRSVMWTISLLLSIFPQLWFTTVTDLTPCCVLNRASALVDTDKPRSSVVSSFKCLYQSVCHLEQVEFNLIERHLFTNWSTKCTLHLHPISVSAVSAVLGQKHFTHIGLCESECWIAVGAVGTDWQPQFNKAVSQPEGSFGYTCSSPCECGVNA